MSLMSAPATDPTENDSERDLVARLIAARVDPNSTRLIAFLGHRGLAFKIAQRVRDQLGLEGIDDIVGPLDETGDQWSGPEDRVKDALGTVGRLLPQRKAPLLWVGGLSWGWARNDLLCCVGDTLGARRSPFSVVPGTLAVHLRYPVRRALNDLRVPAGDMRSGRQTEELLSRLEGLNSSDLRIEGFSAAIEFAL